MNLIKCANEHIYDMDKFESCPHCANKEAKVKVTNILGSNQSEVGTLLPTASAISANSSLLKRKTVGWLVCIEGAMEGESFTLYEGDNHIGRGSNMDVALSKEKTVSRENHAVITYNTQDQTFTLSAKNHLDTTFYNNAPLTENKQLISKDSVRVGDCTLLFIALCDDTFSWN